MTVIDAAADRIALDDFDAHVGLYRSLDWLLMFLLVVVQQKQVTAGFNIVELSAGLDCVSSGRRKEKTTRSVDNDRYEIGIPL